jgi:hypothetical protein
MTHTVEITGRNGFVYDATHLRDDLYIVGHFIVRVENSHVVETVSRATKSSIKRLEKLDKN